MRSLADIDPFGPDVVQEPHEFFAVLRRDAPLYRLPNGAYYLISRYRDVRDAVVNPDVYSSNLVAVLVQGQEPSDRPELIALEGGGARAVDVLAIADPPDGDEFANPDAIDPERRNLESHLGFGLGIHHCIGAALARLPRIALETLRARASAMRHADAKRAYVPSLFVRSLQALPVELAA